jgi:ELWxxDGT repeat protein
VAAELTNGEEVWTSDGTAAAGTFILKDINPGLGSGFGIGTPVGRLHLRIQDGNGYCSRFGGTAGGRVRNVANQRFDVIGPTTVAGCP